MPEDLAAWRRERRLELLARREAGGEEARAEWGRAISRAILAGFPLLADAKLGIYWPVRGEFDPRFLARALRGRGARIGLPVVAGRQQPLLFRDWCPGVDMRPGGLGIPYPAAGAEFVPDACLIPPVGFDMHGFRLGYGAGFFDRTLAALRPRPLAIGVAFECSRMATIHPQPHDIGLDFIVTEAGIQFARAAGLEPVSAQDANKLARDLAQARRRAHEAAAAPAEGSYSSPVCYAKDIAPGYFGEDSGRD
jgi:5-formyltetrahydrofolate cyclo-ligase